MELLALGQGGCAQTAAKRATSTAQKKHEHGHVECNSCPLAASTCALLRSLRELGQQLAGLSCVPLPRACAAPAGAPAEMCGLKRRCGWCRCSPGCSLRSSCASPACCCGCCSCGGGRGGCRALACCTAFVCMGCMSCCAQGRGGGGCGG